jgi:propionyl-CoA carboxylase beta chain
MTDFIFMVKETSHMFITGPDVIKTVTGEEVGFEELGGAMAHNSKSGVAHLAADDEDACLEDTRYLMSFLPQNNLETPPRVLPTDDPLRMDAELDTVVPDNPNKPYDMRNVIRLVVDDGEFFEIHEHWAKNIVVGFSRLNGYAIGVVANQPAQLAGVLDIDASAKAARFVRTCDAFNIPILTFCDVPGFLPGTPSPRRQCRSSPSSPARRTAAPTTSWPPSTCWPTSTSPGRPRRSRSWAPRAR